MESGEEGRWGIVCVRMCVCVSACMYMHVCTRVHMYGCARVCVRREKEMNFGQLQLVKTFDRDSKKDTRKLSVCYTL